MRQRTSEPRSPEEARVVAALLGLLLVIGVYAFMQSPFFAVAEVEVHGGYAVHPHDIVELSGVKTGDNLLTINIQAVAANVIQHPRIERAEVRRRLPGVLLITVVEREPLLLLTNGEDVFGVAGDGTFVPVSEDEAALLPVVHGEVDELDESVLMLANVMPSDVHARVAEVIVDDRRLTLYGRGGETILLGDASELERKLAIVADLLRQNRYVVIDVRFPSSPTVRTAR